MWIPHVILLINSETDSPKSTRGSCDLYLLTKNLSSNQISSRDDKMSAALGCPIILRLFLRPQTFAMSGTLYLLGLGLLLSGTPSLGNDCPYKPTATEKFDYMLDLSGNGEYFLFWKFNTTHITFEAHAKTHGWLGLGLSHTGRMYPADMVTGWVKPDGSIVFTVKILHHHYQSIWKLPGLKPNVSKLYMYMFNNGQIT